MSKKNVNDIEDHIVYPVQIRGSALKLLKKLSLNLNKSQIDLVSEIITSYSKNLIVEEDEILLNRPKSKECKSKVISFELSIPKKDPRLKIRLKALNLIREILNITGWVLIKVLEIENSKDIIIKTELQSYPGLPVGGNGFDYCFHLYDIYWISEDKLKSIFQDKYKPVKIETGSIKSLFKLRFEKLYNKSEIDLILKEAIIDHRYFENFRNLILSNKNKLLLLLRFESNFINSNEIVRLCKDF